MGWSTIDSSSLVRQQNLRGSLHPDFAPVAKALGRQIASYRGGAAACVYHRGECVVDLWGGTRNERGDPWREDTLSPSFSTTKGVASTLVHIMVDRGLLDYERPLCDYWPEFARNGKHQITLRHVLTHQAGLYHIRRMIDRAERMLDWDYMVRAIEHSKPAHGPGERTGYHGLTYGFIVGEVLRRVTGRTVPMLVAEELVEPLGLDGMYIGAPRHAFERTAELIWPKRSNWVSRLPLASPLESVSSLGDRAGLMLRRASGAIGREVDAGSLIEALAPHGISDFDFGAEKTLEAVIPAGNGLFTARSLARMYAALSLGGEIDGVRLMTGDTLSRAIERQPRAPRLAVLPFDMRWRLGYHGIMTTRGSPGCGFGHFGFGGSGAWADLEHELAVAMVLNCGMGTPFGDTRVARLSGSALSCARRRQTTRVSRTRAGRRRDRRAMVGAPSPVMTRRSL